MGYDDIAPGFRPLNDKPAATFLSTHVHVMDARILVIERLMALPVEALHPDMSDPAVEAAIYRVIHSLKQQSMPAILAKRDQTWRARCQHCLTVLEGTCPTCHGTTLMEDPQ